MKPLEGKIALVTGSSQGIGRAIASRLASDGAQVIINYVGNQAAATEAVTQISDLGGRAVAIQGDLSQVVEIEKLFALTLEQFGKLDILVNNAGIATLMPLPDITEAEFDRVFNHNAKGTLFCLKQAALHLADNWAGRQYRLQHGGFSD